MTTNKTEAKRYDCMYGFYTMYEDEDGEYVELEDYEALQAECEKLRKDAETERATQRAAEVLPPGFSIEIEIEKGASLVSLLGPGSRVSCDFQGDLADQINGAIDAAIDAAIEI